MIIVLIIIFSEMLEAVGHEFMEEFFTCCESALAEDGLLVLQVRDTRSTLFTFSLQFSRSSVAFLSLCLTLLALRSSFQYQMRGMMNTGRAQTSLKSTYSPVDACLH